MLCTPLCLPCGVFVPGSAFLPPLSSPVELALTGWRADVAPTSYSGQAQNAIMAPCHRAPGFPPAMLRALFAGSSPSSPSRICPLHNHAGANFGAKEDTSALPMQDLNHRMDNPAPARKTTLPGILALDERTWNHLPMGLATGRKGSCSPGRSGWVACLWVRR